LSEIDLGKSALTEAGTRSARRAAAVSARRRGGRGPTLA
jgi:hypothetical protein